MIILFDVLIKEEDTMKGTLTIHLPENVESALEEATREEGLSPNDIVK